jgi:ADP-ribose pyrophosphatase YjhB (NUDIX family)
MHRYQKHILDLLRGSDHLRYSELQPDGVESSHFKYHLDGLLREGLVLRIDRGVYALSDSGRATVDHLSAGRIQPQRTPKVITYVLLKDQHTYYLQRKDKEPYRGLVNMVGGKLHEGEHGDQAALREVAEKTGYIIPAVQLGATAEIRIRRDDTLISHVIALVYTAVLPERRDDDGLVSTTYQQLSQLTELAPDTLQLISALEQTSSLQHLNLDISL